MDTLLFVIAVSTLPMQTATPSAPQVGTVTGYVWTAENVAIPDAAVLLRNTVSGEISRRTTTDRSGAFTFAAVAPGPYIVELANAGDPASMMAVGKPFTLLGGETVATFVRLGATQPLLIEDRSPATVTGNVGWSKDMTFKNKRMSGGSVEIGVPIGSGAWVAVEGGFFQSTYPHPVFEPSHVRRVSIQISGRMGNRHRHGVFAQVAAGFWRQDLDLEGLGGSRETGQFQSDDVVFTIGPGVGVDVPVGKRLSLVILAELQVLPQHPRDRWVHPKVAAGLTFRIPRD